MLIFKHAEAEKLADGVRVIPESEPPKPCPYCGGEGVFNLISTEKDGLFVSVGCRTRGCREYVIAQPTASPMSGFLKLLKDWNTRAK